MRAFVAIALVALLSVSLAGCAKDPVRYPNGVTSHSGSLSKSGSGSLSGSASGSHSASGSSTGIATSNHAPTGSLGAVVNGTAVRFSLNGTDADHDALTWNLTFGDQAKANGTSLPAAVNHTYSAAGLYQVNYTLTDGHNATTYHVALNVTGATAAAGGPFFDATKTWTASQTGVYEFALGCDSDGGDCAYFDLPAGSPGRPFTMDFSGTVPGVVYWIDYYNAGGYDNTFQGSPGAASIADSVPAGTIQFRAYSTGGAMLSAHLVIP
jgi:PKD repeat protein